MNILAASLEAMIRAVANLKTRPGVCLVDGNQPLPAKIHSRPVIKGDAKCLSIAAASIIAKCVRDQIMEGLDSSTPDTASRNTRDTPPPPTKKRSASWDHHPPIASPSEGSEN